VGERVIEGPEMIEVTNAKVDVAKEKLKEARTRQKSYADKHHRSLEFQPEGRYNLLYYNNLSFTTRATIVNSPMVPRFLWGRWVKVVGNVWIVVEWGRSEGDGLVRCGGKVW
nr:putative nucleotidyltransferase, ribonuclease H [Tanacetum cinerariifolium]